MKYIGQLRLGVHPSEHVLDKLLQQQAKELILTRSETESSVMFDGRDSADTICAELRELSEQATAQARELSERGKGGFLNNVKRHIPGLSDSIIETKDAILGTLNIIERHYEASTRIRKSFQWISALAYMDEVPVYTNTYQQLKRDEWRVMCNVKMSGNSPWRDLGFDDDGFQCWWRNRLTLCKLPSSVEPEWKDLQAFGSAVILLLEHLGSSELSGTSLDVHFERLADNVKLLTCRLYDLIVYPEYFSFTSELFCYSAAAIYVAINCVESFRASCSKQKRAEIGDVKILTFYHRKVSCLDDLVDDLSKGSKKLLDKARNSSRNARLRAPIMESGFSRDSEHEESEAEQINSSIRALRVYDVKVFRDLELPEIKLSNARGRQLGFGSYAIVFERHTPGGTKCYAVKEPIRVNPLNRDSLWNRVGREAQIWRLLKHDNILALRGFCLLPDDIPALVMDICRYNLRQFLEVCSPVSERQKLELLYDVVKGLCYVHSQSIAHGDLRACNILVKEHPSVSGWIAVLSDFGTSYFVDGAVEPLPNTVTFKTTRGQVGNASWLSPELLKKVESQDGEEGYWPYISLPGDIYSFGCIFLEVMYECEPYQAYQTEEQRRMKKLEGCLPATPEETSMTYFPFLRLLWNPIPEDRPSANQVAEAVHNLLQPFAP